MEMKDLLQLGICAIKHQVPASTEFSNENFSVEDVKTAFTNELKALCPDRQTYRKNKADVFTLLEKTIDAVLPQKVNQIIGQFAEIQTVGQNERSVFKGKVGKNRAKQFVTEVGLSGRYETFRLDVESFSVTATAIGGAALVDLERMLDGHESIEDYFDIVLEGIEDKIYAMMQAALESAHQAGQNKVTMTQYDDKAMKYAINLVSAYGKPVLFCTQEFANELVNLVHGTYVSEKDVDEIRDKGYVGKIYGADVVIMPQSFTDETNATKVFNPALAYVLPAGEKPVKVVFEGDAMVREIDNNDWSKEIQTYKKVGVGVMANNNWVTIENSALKTANTNGSPYGPETV